MTSAFDNNAWYQLTELRVGFNSSYYANGIGTYFAARDFQGPMYWQMLFLGDDSYQMRNNAQPKKQLATCYDPTEKDDSKTIPCMQTSSGADSQKWRVTTWTDGTYRISNVGNGTGYNLDVHPGNPPFMSNQTAALPRQPAQHWMFSSVSVIDDGAWSTTVTELPSSTSTPTSSKTRPASTSATTTPASSSSTSSATAAKSSDSLSAGASAGIGVGVALAVVGLLGLALFLVRRHRQRRYRAVELDDSSVRPPPPPELPGPPGYNEYAGSGKAQEIYTPPAELHGEMRMHELGTEARGGR